jgi:hypothetical protein
VKPAHLPCPARADGRHRLRIGRVATAVLAPVLRTGREQNTYVPPATPRTILPVSAIRLPNK